ncbi:MAG: hypothetical protein NZ765_13540, partial [Anaerolineae bacterium]|nr:hypothetical protein [Anaerolineae bacterium]
EERHAVADAGVILACVWHALQHVVLLVFHSRNPSSSSIPLTAGVGRAMMEPPARRWALPQAWRPQVGAVERE